jgi:integrase
VRQQKYKTVHGTLADAKRELRGILELQQQNPAPDPVHASLTVADFAAVWYADTVTPRIESGMRDAIGRKAAETYQTLSRLYIEPYDQLGGSKLSALTARQVAAWIVKLSRTPTAKRKQLSAKTVTEAARVLRSICDLAVARGHLVVNPFTVKDHNGKAVVQLPQRERATTRGALPIETIDALLAELDDADNAIAPIVRLLVWTGLRIGELLALPWEAVDLKQGVVFVRQALTETRAELRIKPSAKTLAGARVVALTDDAVELLRRLRKARGRTLPADALVFPDPRHVDIGEFPISPRKIGKRFSKFVGRRPHLHVNGRVPTPHWLRHSFVSHSLMAGADAATVAAQAGHSTLRVQQIYTDVLIDAKRAAAKALQDRLRNRSTK